MRRKCLLAFSLLTFISLSACRTGAEQTEIMNELKTEDQTSGHGNMDSSTPTVEKHPNEQKENATERTEENRLKLLIGESVFTATLVDNSTTGALKELLAKGPITINMRDYAGMEKVGPFGTDLPRNDEKITTEAGDLILYQGNAFVIYYAPNSWNFTRIGKIDDVTQEELKEVLGSADVTVTLSLD
jgi:hypothetical protein